MKSQDKKNIIYNSIKTCISIIFPVITFPYVTRVLKVDNVGKINFSLSVVSYFSILSSLGISTYAIRECSKKKGDYDGLSSIASELYSINIVSTIFSLLLLFALVSLNSVLNKYSILISIFSISIIATTLGTDWINIAMEDFRFITIRTFAFQLLSIVLMFAFVKTESDYIIYALIHILSGVLICISNTFYRRKYCDIKFTFNFNLKKHLLPVVMLFVTILSQNIFNNCDVTMIGVQLGDYYVGLYSTAHKIINILFMVVVSICYVVIPQLTRMFKDGSFDEINSLLYQISCFTISLGLPIVVGLNLIPKELMLLVGGQDFLSAADCLRVLSISMFISFFVGIIGNMVLIPSGDDSLYMKSTLFAMIVNVILNYFLIPFYGIEGAAAATALSQIVELLIVVYYMNKKVTLNRIGELFVIPTLASIMIVISKVIVFAITDGLYVRVLLTVILSSVLYFTILVLSKNDFAISFIYPILRKVGIKI